MSSTATSISVRTLGLAPQPPLELELLEGAAACDWLARDENKRAWTELLQQCPWGTAFQSPRFAEIWWRHYAPEWTPLLVVARTDAGDLAGLMPLALKADLITGVGANQAEYHGWTCGEELAHAFGGRALEALARAYPKKSMRLRYLPPAFPSTVVTRLRDANKQILLLPHRSHELALDAAEISKSLQKKSNKSKVNRLKRCGELRMRRLDAGELTPHFRRIMSVYDARQGAVNDVCPFRDDPKKAAFHLDWLRSAPDQLHVTALFVDRELCSALWLVTSGTDVHLAISAYAPEFAAHSPVKFHLYETALSLAADGRRTLDLTPGGDPWKERFSTGERDVWELVMHRSPAEAARKHIARAVKGSVRKALARVGLDSDKLRRGMASLRAGSRTIVRPSLEETRYRLAPNQSAGDATGTVVTSNDLDFVLRHGPALTAMPRQPLLQLTLARIEGGDECCCVTDRGAPVCMAWRSRGADPRIYDLGVARPADLRRALAALVDHARESVGGPDQALVVAVPRSSPLSRTLAGMGFTDAA